MADLGRLYKDGEIIVREGDSGDCMYVVQKGRVDILTKSGDREVVLRSLGRNDFFGEMALLLEDTPRTADVTATEPTTCVIITKWDLRSTLTTHPDIGVKMMGELARRLRDTNQAVGD